MRRVLRWLAIGMAGLIGLIVVAAVSLSIIGTAKLRKTRVIVPEEVPIPTDSAALARGQHVAHFACTGCHGADLTGDPLFVDATFGAIYAPNLTGVAATHTAADLVRAIRHAVAPDGRELLIMPAEGMRYLSREDLGALIAYLMTLKYRGDDLPKPHLTFAGKVGLGAGLFGKVFPAEEIDHHTPFPPMPRIGANVETGKYLSRLCYGCHGPDLAGGTSPDPAAPPAPNLIVVKAWSERDFLNFSRTGRTPSGRQIDPQFMPWEFFGKLDPDELSGLYVYLHSRP